MQDEHLPSSFSDSRTLLGGKRCVQTCDYPAFEWDVVHTEATAVLNCYVSDENEQILFKISIGLTYISLI